MEESTRELFTSLVRSSLHALCRNKTLINSVRKIDSLIGITLENNEVLLINISEYVNGPDDKQVIIPRSSGVSLTGKTVPSRDEEHVYPYNPEEEEATESIISSNENAPAISASHTNSNSAEACCQQSETNNGHSDDCMVDDDNDDWTLTKQKIAKKRKRKSNKIPIVMKIHFPEGFENYQAVDEEPCCKCHPRSSGVCIRCHPEGSRCNASCKNRNCQWRQIQDAIETQEVPSNQLDATEYLGQKDDTDICCNSNTGKMYLEADWLNPPEPAESDLQSLNLTKETVLSLYADADSYINFACSVMCKVFTEEERLVECNVQGWAKRPKLDTDPEQKKMNAIYNLINTMYRVPEEEKESVKKKAITSIDSRNRQLRRTDEKGKRKL